MHEGVDDGMMKTRSWFTLSCIHQPMSIAGAMIRFLSRLINLVQWPLDSMGAISMLVA